MSKNQITTNTSHMLMILYVLLMILYVLLNDVIRMFTWQKLNHQCQKSESKQSQN
jgi:hypothetical protein